MQDRYAGDVGDYAKLLFLKAVCGAFAHDDRMVASPGLGIVWYRCDPSEVDRAKADKDGGSVEYLLPNGGGKVPLEDVELLRASDPELYRLLQQVVHVQKKRSVPELQRKLQEACYLPSARFYDRLLSLSGKVTEK